MVKIQNMLAGILSNQEAIEKFSSIIIERPAGKAALRSELKSWFEKEGISSVRTSGHSQIINPILASKKRTNRN